MTPSFAGLLRSAHGVRLDQERYERDFGASLWQADGADCWKLERLQDYAETGFPSWEAFMAGDWDRALALYEEERAGIEAFLGELQRHRAEPDGAVRYADPDLVAAYEDFAHGLYESGEDVESYFLREIAQLPPPGHVSPGR